MVQNEDKEKKFRNKICPQSFWNCASKRTYGCVISSGRSIWSGQALMEETRSPLMSTVAFQQAWGCELLCACEHVDNSILTLISSEASISRRIWKWAGGGRLKFSQIWCSFLKAAAAPAAAALWNSCRREGDLLLMPDRRQSQSTFEKEKQWIVFISIVQS